MDNETTVILPDAIEKEVAETAVNPVYRITHIGTHDSLISHHPDQNMDNILAAVSEHVDASSSDAMTGPEDGATETSAALQQELEAATADLSGQHYIILADNDNNAINMESPSDVEGLKNKRLKIEGEDGQTYYLTLQSGLTGQVSATALTEDIHTLGVKQGSGVKQAPDDISQAWFTTRDDKNALQIQGCSWKQGQWTKEETALLQVNIAKYCKDFGIGDPEDIIFKMTKDLRKDFYRTIARGLQRPLFSVYRRVIRLYDQKNHMGRYSREEMIRLRELRMKHGCDWAMIGAALGRSASSVKDKCRLMKDTCNAGKWLPAEEQRLSAAVYNLSGCKIGENVTQGLSWSLVAEQVATRSEKQCRTKWLNFLNWKQKGGTEWTREDDINLVIKIGNLGVNDESQIDWTDLASNWTSVRSPQWLRGKWWSLKRHVQDYQQLPFQDILECLRTMHMHVRLKGPSSNVRVARVELPQVNLSSDMAIQLPLQGSSSLTSVQHGGVDETMQAYEVLQHLTPTSSGTYLITQPQTNPSISGPGADLATDHIIVHTLPVSSVQSAEAVGSNNNVMVQLNNPQVIISTAGSGVTSLDPTSLTTLTNAIHMTEAISQEQHDLGQSELHGDGLHLANNGEIIHVSSSTEYAQHIQEIAGSDMSSMSTTVTSDLVLVNATSPQYVQSGSSAGELLSSFTDPMLTSNSSDLIGSTSDIEGDKSQSNESDMVPIEN